MKSLRQLTILFLFLCCHTEGYSQGAFPRSKWFEDDLTLKLSEKTGLRLVFEPQFGQVISTRSNRIKPGQYATMPKFGFEVNLLQSAIAFQPYMIFPSSAEFDEDSPIISQGVIANSMVDIDFGYGGGLTFFNSMVSVGVGQLLFDRRDFNKENSNYTSSMLKTGFFYINLQPLSIVKAVVRATKATRLAPGKSFGYNLFH